MSKLRIGLGLIASVWAFSALAASDPAIRNSVAVCDPNSPTHCAAPDASGALPISGSITASNPSVGTNGAAAPTSSTQIGILVGGNLQPVSTSNPTPVTIVSGGGSGGTSSAFGAAFPAQGTAVGFKDSAGANLAAGNLDASGNIKVNVAAGGAGGGAVYGPTAVGAAAANPPVLVAGTANATATGNVQVMKVDTSGNASVTVGTALPAGSAIIGNIRVDQTTPGTTNGVVVNSSALPTGAATSALQTTGNTALTTINTTLGTPFQAGGSIGNTSFAVTQGTAANLKAQVTGAGTAGTADAGVQTIQGIASMTPVQVSQASAGSLNATVVNGGTFAVQNTAATPAGTNVIGHVIADSGSTTAVTGTLAVTQSGTWTVQPGNVANTTAWKVDGSASTQPISAAALPLPALAATSTKQSDGTQKTQIVDGSGNVIASTSNNLNVQCANCSGSGASAADEASFTAGTSTFAPMGGFYQTTPTANPLTTGQQGFAQMTANRAVFNNLRNASGTEVGTASTPLQVSLANTGTNATSVKVDGSAVTQPVSGTVSITSNSSVNVAQVNGITTSTGAGSTGTGTQRVGVAQDATTLAGSAPGTAGVASSSVLSVQGIASMTPLQVSQATAASLNATVVGTGTFAVQNTAALPAGTNVIGHVIADSGSVVAATQSGTWTVQPGNVANTTAWKVDGSAVTQPVSAASLPLPALAATSTKQSDGTQKTQIVDGSGNVIASTSNNLNVQCANCSGSGASAADGATFTAGSSTFAPMGGFYQTTATSNPLTTGQQGFAQMTANRAVFNNLRNASGTEVGTASTPLQVSLANTGTNATAVKVDGSGVTQPVSGTVTANAGTNLNTSALALESSLSKLPLAQGSTTSGQSGPLIQGAVTTGAPTYTTAQTSPLSLDTSGNLRVAGTFSIAANSSVNLAQVNGVTTSTGAGATGTGTQRVGVAQDTTTIAGAAPGTAGTASSNVLTVQGVASMTPVQVSQATASNLNATVVGTGTLAVQNTAATPSGTNLIGKVGIDQTTPGTTNGVQVNAALPAGTNVIGHIIADSGSTTAVTGTVAVTESGTWNITNVSGTVSLPTGASTAANQTATLGSAAGGTAATSSTLVGGVYNTTPPTLTNGQQASTQLDASGNLKVAGTITIAANQSVNVSQVNGATVNVGTGAAGTGTQRVTTSTDSTIGTVTAVTGITNTVNVAGTGTAGTANAGVVTVQGIASMTPLLVTPASNSSVNLSQVNGVTTSTGAGTTGTGTQRVGVAQDTTTIAGAAPGTAGSASSNVVTVQGIASMTALTVGGGAANNATTAGNPIQQSCLAASSEPTLATSGQNASCITDLAHKQIVLPYANPENFVSGTTSAMTGTTSTSLIASPGAGLRNYITQITCVNSHATVGTFVTIQDGSGGTALYTVAAASVFGGSALTFPTPLRQPSTATAIYVANVTTGANVICSATGYKGS